MNRDRLTDLAWSLLVGAVVLAPMLLGRGFVLQGDMVFVPRQPWKGAWLGLDGAAGRFVPGDAVVSLLTQVVPGDLLQKALLLAIFVVGGVGAGRLVDRQPAVARAAGITLYLWNPWVYERLAIGQWGVVVGYAVLPWVVITARAFRDDPRAGWPGLVVTLGASAVCSPPAALMAVLAGACVVAAVRPSRASARRLGTVLGVGAVVNLPWIVPALLAPSGTAVAPGQFGAFAARAESEAGVLLSVASLGGVWKSSIVPPERESVAVLLMAGLLTLVALAGLRLHRDPDAATRRGLLVLATISLLVGFLPSLPPVESFLDGAAAVVPPLGLVRDSHRFLGPVALVLLIGFAAVVGRAWNASRPGRESLRLVAVALVLWPVICLPSLAWGLRGAFAPVEYPQEWADVRSVLGPGPTVVLPWTGSYRGFGWNDGTAILDPAPRYFPGEVLIDDRIVLDTQVLASEEPLLRRVDEALRSADPAASLAGMGIDQVLLEKDNGVDVADVPEGRVVHDGPLLHLVALDTTVDLDRPRPPVGAVVAADIVALGILLLGIATIARRHLYGVPRITSPGEGL